MDVKHHTHFAVILRACAMAIGVAGFAILFSYSIDEVYSLATGIQPVALQLLVFQILQIAFALFVLWPCRHSLLPARINPLLLVFCLCLGLCLALYFSIDLQARLGIVGGEIGVVRLTHEQLVFASPSAHALTFLVYSALLAPIAENLIYRQMIFHEAEHAPHWGIAAGSILTFALAYAFNGGIEGAVFALQFGAVLTLLRVVSGSVLYPIVAHMAYGFASEAATLARYLP